MHEVRIDGEVVYDGRILRLEVDRVRLPSGREVVREVVRHRGAAVVVPVDRDGSLLLVRQFRYPTGEALLELPAGKLDGGEGAVACAGRELVEETGMAAGELVELGWFYTTPGFSDERIGVVLARDLTAVEGAELDPDEVESVVRLRLEEIFEQAADGRIRDAKTLAALLLARTRGYL
jgi:ADP-ribose pyrophosphatase